MTIPEEEIKISKLSIYAGREGKSVTTYDKKVPLLYSGIWIAKDNNIGIAMASISDNPIPVDLNMNTKDYPLAAKGKVYITTIEGKKLLTSYTAGSINTSFSIQPKEVCIIEIVPSE
jgi:hypothetical protein